jgi:hypothetical protein
MSGPIDTDAPAQDEQEIRYVQSRPATSGVVNADAGRFATRRSSQPIPANQQRRALHVLESTLITTLPIFWPVST